MSRKSAYGTRRKVTENSALKLTEQIIYADKCRGLTPATNRGFIRNAIRLVFFYGQNRDTPGQVDTTKKFFG